MNFPSREKDGGPFWVLDGGLATELEKHGADLRDPLWSGKVLLESPELVERVSYDFYAAGACFQCQLEPG